MENGEVVETEPMDKPNAGEHLPERAENASASLVTLADEDFIRDLETAAELAPRLETALFKVVCAVAYPEDWSDQDGRACLSSAGAERFLKHFPISFSDWEKEKTEWEDDNGKAYRWIYRAIASFKGRQVLCEGRFSTRNALLGKANKQWKPLKDIDESDIMAAALHICQAAGIKQLLGLRGIPVSELVKFGVPAEKIKKVERRKGAQGGSTATEEEKGLQAEVRRMIMEMVNNDKTEAVKYLEAITTFMKDGKQIPGLKNPAALVKARLNVTLDKVTKEYDEWKAAAAAKEEPASE